MVISTIFLYFYRIWTFNLNKFSWIEMIGNHHNQVRIHFFYCLLNYQLKTWDLIYTFQQKEKNNYNYSTPTLLFYGTCSYCRLKTSIIIFFFYLGFDPVKNVEWANCSVVHALSLMTNRIRIKWIFFFFLFHSIASRNRWRHILLMLLLLKSFSNSTLKIPAVDSATSYTGTGNIIWLLIVQEINTNKVNCCILNIFFFNFIHFN